MSHFAKGQIIIGKEYQYPAGALNVAEVKDDGSVVAYPQGGGFQMTFSPESLVKNKFRIVAPEEIKATAYKPGKFELDCWEGRAFEGWATGESWNGWAKPMFPLEEANDIMALCNNDGTGTKATYEKAKDRFVFVSEHDDEPMICQGTKIAGVAETVYPIGTGSWTWMETPKPKPEDEDADEEE